MADIRRWSGIEPPADLPGSASELVAMLEQLSGAGSRWSDLLDGLRDSVHRYGGAAAGVSFDVACRRAEQAFLQLEIALRDARVGQVG